MFRRDHHAHAEHPNVPLTSPPDSTEVQTHLEVPNMLLGPFLALEQEVPCGCRNSMVSAEEPVQRKLPEDSHLVTHSYLVESDKCSGFLLKVWVWGMHPVTCDLPTPPQEPQLFSLTN